MHSEPRKRLVEKACRQAEVQRSPGRKQGAGIYKLCMVITVIHCWNPEKRDGLGSLADHWENGAKTPEIRGGRTVELGLVLEVLGYCLLDLWLSWNG